VVTLWDEIEKIERIAVSGIADKMHPTEKFKDIRTIALRLLEYKNVDYGDVHVGRGPGKTRKSK
jgi:hypothetical protein